MFFPRTFIISVLMGLVLCTLASAIHVDVSNSTCNSETNRFPTPNFNRAMLQEHNNLRKQHELRPLKWDKKLQIRAQDDASRCHVEQPVPEGQSASVAWVGQFNAIQLFDSLGGFNPNNTAEMVRREAKRIGCAEAACSPFVGPRGVENATEGRNTIHVICHYSPPR